VVSLVPADEQIALAADAAGVNERDETLDLYFLCCHPALSTASQVALTLRAVGGLTTGEIARAFFVPEATMAQRLTRAKQTIRSAGTAFPELTPSDRAVRLPVVLKVIYLIFNEGYTQSGGDHLYRIDLSSEAIRVARLLSHLLPEDPEVGGLLALMLLTDARRTARTGQNGELIPLDEQVRSLWDQSGIAVAGKSCGVRSRAAPPVLPDSSGGCRARRSVEHPRHRLGTDSGPLRVALDSRTTRWPVSVTRLRSMVDGPPPVCKS
jgi:predicted RNA polymerase sigma factor